MKGDATNLDDEDFADFDQIVKDSEKRINLFHEPLLQKLRNGNFLDSEISKIMQNFKELMVKEYQKVVKDVEAHGYKNSKKSKRFLLYYQSELEKQFQLYNRSFSKYSGSKRYIELQSGDILDGLHVQGFINTTNTIINDIQQKIRNGDRKFILPVSSLHIGGLSADSLIEVNLDERHISENDTIENKNVQNLVRDIALMQSHIVEERQADKWPPMFLSGSSYSGEDLISNYIGAEIAIRQRANNVSQRKVELEVLAELKPVNTLSSSDKPDVGISYTYRPKNYTKNSNNPSLFDYEPELDETGNINGLRVQSSEWNWNN